eukprot:858895-Amphidinium_carterae.1
METRVTPVWHSVAPPWSSSQKSGAGSPRLCTSGAPDWSPSGMLEALLGMLRLTLTDGRLTSAVGLQFDLGTRAH